MDVRRLREENEELRERVVQLEAMLQAKPAIVDGFMPLQIRLLTIIAKRPNGVSYDSLFGALYADRKEDEEPERKALAVVVCMARKRLRDRYPHIVVETLWGWGFKMDLTSRRAWLDLVERAS